MDIAAVTASISPPTAPYLSPLAPAPRSAERLAEGFPTSSLKFEGLGRVRGRVRRVLRLPQRRAPDPFQPQRRRLA
jgi:hypothetical protein